MGVQTWMPFAIPLKPEVLKPFGQYQRTHSQQVSRLMGSVALS